MDPSIRFYQASSSEMFGKVREVPQNETTRSTRGVPTGWPRPTDTPHRQLPRVVGLYAVSGILFNHESPRRGIEFVTRKVTDGVARIVAGLDKS